MIRRLVRSLLLTVVVGAVMQSLPDIGRYLRIREM